MPTRTGYAHHNYLIGHNTSPDRNKTNPSPNRPHAAEPTRKALVTRESTIDSLVLPTELCVAQPRSDPCKQNPSPHLASLKKDRSISERVSVPTFSSAAGTGRVPNDEEFGVKLTVCGTC